MKITVEQIGLFLSFLVALISSIDFLTKRVKKQLSSISNPINNSIRELDISQCKNFLVNFLSELETEKKLDKLKIARAYEIYDHYTNDLKQNSYIHERWEELMKGKNYE